MRLHVVADLSKTVGNAWLRKLHGRLSRHRGYLNFTLRLADTLKTRTDRTYERAIECPATVNLEQVIGTPAVWENLGDDKKAVVQLLLGQNEISEGIDVVRQHVEQLRRLLTFDLNLNSPTFIEEQTKDAAQGSAKWLTSAHRQAELVGRSWSGGIMI